MSASNASLQRGDALAGRRVATRGRDGGGDLEAAVGHLAGPLTSCVWHSVEKVALPRLVMKKTCTRVGRINPDGTRQP